MGAIVTGRVKDYFWDQICAAEPENDCEPDDLEMLEADAELARERYETAKKAAEGRSTEGENK